MQQNNEWIGFCRKLEGELRENDDDDDDDDGCLGFFNEKPYSAENKVYITEKSQTAHLTISAHEK